MMKVKLLRNARIFHHAGEIVDVTPEEKQFLTSVGSAVEVKTVEEAEKKPAPKKAAKK